MFSCYDTDFLPFHTFTLGGIMEETNQSPTDHRGLKLQNIIQKLSEHCDIKNPEELEIMIDEDESDLQQAVPETKRRKQDTSDTSVNGSKDDTHSLHSATEENTKRRHSDLKLRNNRTKSEQQEDNSCKAFSTPPPPERISARIRSLKSKKVTYKEDWVDPDQIRLSGERVHAHSNKNNSHEEITKPVVRKRKRKKKESFQSVEDYVNEAPLIHVGNLVGLRKCCLCAVMFVEKEQLLDHMKAVHHLDDKMNITKEATTESLQSDDKRDTQSIPDEKPFKCLQCEASFRKSSGLKQHVTRQHSQNTPQKSTPVQANQTVRNTSAIDRPYACQVCGKAFKRKHHLQEHSYIHSDDKPYKCDTCSKTFNQRICLTKHLPCREHEKQHRKPTSTKTLETCTGDVLHEEPQNQVNDPLEQLFDYKETEVSLTESRSVCGLAENNHSNSESKSSSGPCKAPEVKRHVNGSEHDGKSHLSNGVHLRDNPSSKDTENHATNAVECGESVTLNSKLNVSGVLSSTSAVLTVTKDQSSSVKKPTATSQGET